MRPQDKEVFGDAATSLNLWILVRRTNPASLKYIGKHGFTPKPLNCKAKTADLGKAAGLVVDASLHKTSFRPAKLESAMRIWKEFAKKHLGRDGFDVETSESSAYYGCLTLNGKYIHGDYDLYDIIIPGQERGNLVAMEEMLGQPHRRGPKVLQVQKYINERIGVEMVQHGYEAGFADHSQQSIDVFGPGGEETTILNEFSVRGWYRDKFKGRQTLPVK